MRHRQYARTGKRQVRHVWVTCAVALFAAMPIAADTPATVTPDVEVERIGEPTIDRGNNYSENTRVRIRLVYPPLHPRAGEQFRGYDGPIHVEEWMTAVYDGEHGATRLPLDVRAPQGEVQLVLKSLARYSHIDQRNMPVPQIAVAVGAQRRLVQIPQWVDADGNDKIDWLEHRVDDLLAQARASNEPDVARAAAALRGWEQSFKRDCGGFDQQRPGWITVAPACVDWDGVDSHRVNRGLELTATVLHELWHLWSHDRSARGARGRPFAKAIGVRVEPLPCPFGCQGPVWLTDLRYEAEEDDAEAFADRYKHLFP